jgi:hypothetical protein
LSILLLEEVLPLKKGWIVTIAISAGVLTACGTHNNNLAENGTLYHKNGNNINVREHADIYNQNPGTQEDDNFGFVRQIKSPVPGKTIDPLPIKLSNREDTANMISKLTVTLPNVVDSSVLVTDQEILIAYQISDTNETARFETADQVKKTAMGSVPDWYHVYVTDDPALRQDVKNIASMNAYSANKDKTVRKTVKLMLERSPQGHQDLKWTNDRNNY